MNELLFAVKLRHSTMYLFATSVKHACLKAYFFGVAPCNVFTAKRFRV